MDRALLVIIALILSAISGIWWHKLTVGLRLTQALNYPARALRDFERQFNSGVLSDKDLSSRGYLFAALVIGASLFTGFLFSLIFRNHIFTLIILSLLLPVGSSWTIASSIKKNLKANNVPAARQQLDGTVFRHHAVMDAASLTRAAIEYLSVQFAEKILSPVFWFMLLAIPGLFASIAISLLYETIAGAGNKASPFTKAISRVNFIFNYIPVRLAAFLWVLAGLFLPSVNLSQATKQISQEMPMGEPDRLAILCAAGSLNLTLGGKTSGYYNDGWIGAGRTMPSSADISRVQFLYIILCVLLVVSLGPFI